MSGRGKHESFDEWLARKAAKKEQPKQVSGFGGLKRTKGLNPISEKGRKKKRAIQKAYESHFSKEENRYCDCCGTSDGLSVHHTKKRLGDNASNEETFVTLCIIGNYMDLQHPQSNHSHSGGCHGWIEANKSWARQNGYLV